MFVLSECFVWFDIFIELFHKDFCFLVLEYTAVLLREHSLFVARRQTKGGKFFFNYSGGWGEAYIEE